MNTRLISQFGRDASDLEWIGCLEKAVYPRRFLEIAKRVLCPSIGTYTPDLGSPYESVESWLERIAEEHYEDGWDTVMTKQQEISLATNFTKDEFYLVSHES